MSFLVVLFFSGVLWAQPVLKAQFYKDKDDRPGMSLCEPALTTGGGGWLSKMAWRPPLKGLEKDPQAPLGFLTDSRQRAMLLSPWMDRASRQIVTDSKPYTRFERERAYNSLNVTPRYVESVVVPSLKIKHDSEVLILIENRALGLRFFGALDRSAFDVSPNYEIELNLTENRNLKGLRIRLFKPEEFVINSSTNSAKPVVEDYLGGIKVELKGKEILFPFSKDVEIEHPHLNFSPRRWELSAPKEVLLSSDLMWRALNDVPRASNLIGLPPVEFHQKTKGFSLAPRKNYDVAAPDQVALWLIAKGLHRTWPSGSVDFDVTVVPLNPSDRNLIVPGVLRWAVFLSKVALWHRRQYLDKQGHFFERIYDFTRVPKKYRDVYYVHGHEEGAEIPLQVVNWVKEDTVEGTRRALSAGQLESSKLVFELPGGGDFVVRHGDKLERFLQTIDLKNWELDRSFLFQLRESRSSFEGAVLLRMQSLVHSSYEYFLYHPTQALSRFQFNYSPEQQSADTLNFVFLSDLDVSKIDELKGGFSIEFALSDQPGTGRPGGIRVAPASQGSNVFDSTAGVMSQIPELLEDLNQKYAARLSGFVGSQKFVEEWSTTSSAALEEMQTLIEATKSGSTQGPEILEKLTKIKSNIESLDMRLRSLSADLVLKTERGAVQNLIFALRGVKRENFDVERVRELRQMVFNLSQERAFAERLLVFLANMRQGKSVMNSISMDDLDKGLKLLVELSSDLGVFTGLEGYRDTFRKSLENRENFREVLIQNSLIQLQKALDLYIDLESAVDNLVEASQIE